MCSDGTCYSCRKKAADQNAREGTYAFRWRGAPKPKPTSKRVVDPNGGDPLDTSFLDWSVILRLMGKGEEGGGKGKEQK